MGNKTNTASCNQSSYTITLTLWASLWRMGQRHNLVFKPDPDSIPGTSSGISEGLCSYEFKLIRKPLFANTI